MRPPTRLRAHARSAQRRAWNDCRLSSKAVAMVRTDGERRAQQPCDPAAGVIISRAEQSLFRRMPSRRLRAAAGHFAPRGTNRYPGSDMMKVAFGGGGNDWAAATR